MAVFEEKMKQGTKKLVQLVAQEETPDQIALREACDAYIVQACDRIRQDMERERAANRVRYDVPNAASGEETNPHYLVHWGAEFDVNFKKKEKFYEIDHEHNILRFGFAIPVFYILEEMEKNLALLRQVIATENVADIVATMRRIVPTFKTPEEVNRRAVEQHRIPAEEQPVTV